MPLPYDSPSGFQAVNAASVRSTLDALLWITAVLLVLALSPTALGQAGSLDPSFGEDGWNAVNASISQSAKARALVVQPDGKAVAVGYASTGNSGINLGSFALVRYMPDGTPDPDFGNGGAVWTAIGTTASIDEVALQSDGRIVVAGSATVDGVSVAALARYLPDGSLDAAFGEGGVATSTLGTFGATATGVVVQPDGRLIISGYVHPAEDERAFAVAGFEADGSLDTSFGTGGVSVVEVVEGDGWNFAFDIALQPDGRVVAVGHEVVYIDGSPERSILVARFTEDGSADGTFGTDGVVRTDASERDERARAVELQPDGQIVVAAGIVAPGNFSGLDMAILRYMEDGALDASFGAGGIVTTEFSSPTSIGATDVALLEDGRMLAVATRAGAGDPDTFLARYNADGTPDLTFGEKGRVETNFIPDGSGDGTAVAPLANGQFLMAGYVLDYANGGNTALTYLAAARFDADGGLDSGYGNNGAAFVASIGPGPDYVGGFALTADGRAVVAGKAWNGDAWVLSVARFTADGDIDASFGTDGLVTTDLLSDMSLYVVDAEVLPNGPVLVAANVRRQGEGWASWIVRYTADGDLDVEWGGTGSVAFPSGGSTNERLTGMALQPDGKVVVASGRANDRIARYQPDGTLDVSFGTEGVMAIGVPISIGDLAVQEDGKIIAAISGENGLGTLRLEPSGGFDATYGEGGFALVSVEGSGNHLSEIEIQPDGRIVGGGWAKTNDGTLFALVRFTPQGLPDSSFGTDGLVTTFVGEGEGGVSNALLLQPDGRLVSGGWVYSDEEGYVSAFVRYDPDGSVDHGFGEGGAVIGTFYLDPLAWFENGYETALAWHPEGGIVAALSAVTTRGPDLTVARFLAGAPVSSEQDLSLPTADHLSAPTPNPARVQAALRLTLSHDSDHLEAEVFDLLGRRVAVVHEGVLRAGTHVLHIPVAEFSSGVYIVGVTGERLRLTRKLTVVR